MAVTGANRLRYPDAAAPGDFLLLSVADTGVGMDESTKKRVFEPFFTTKGRGRGTGLGLSSVYGTIKGHNGFVEFTSEPGQGSSFRMYLPLTSRPVEKEPSPAEPGAAGSVSGRILLVDDEESIRETAALMLDGLGYTVAVSADGEEAVAYYRAHAPEIDLVIIDMVMPKLGGYDCFMAMKALNPPVRALVASGYTVNEEATRVIKAGACGFIQKPFSRDELAEAVRLALGGIIT